MFASHHGLDNLNMVVDDNRICMLGHTTEVVSHGDLSARLAAFGWDCAVVDGHDVMAVRAKLEEMKTSANGRPKALIARTIKGRGVPGLEDEALSHVMNPGRDVIRELLE